MSADGFDERLNAAFLAMQELMDYRRQLGGDANPYSGAQTLALYTRFVHHLTTDFEVREQLVTTCERRLQGTAPPTEGRLAL